MDARGRWCNEHGPFENPRIIDRFNRSIRRDENGYYVTQERDNLREKVYFHYVDTPLRVVDVNGKPPEALLINTGERIPMDPSALYVRNDALFMRRGEERIRFSDRALVKLAACLEESDEGLCFRMGMQRFPIPEIPG